MRYHLEKNHIRMFQSLKSKANETTSPTTTPGQLTITESISVSQPMPRSSAKWRKITNAVCYSIVKDMRPLSTVEDEGFCHLLRTLESKYERPSRKSLSNNYLPDIYQEERQ